MYRQVVTLRCYQCKDFYMDGARADTYITFACLHGIMAKAPLIDDQEFIDALNAYEEPLTTKEIAEEVGTVQSNAARRLRLLEQAGKVKDAGTGDYGNILWAPARRRRRTKAETDSQRPHIQTFAQTASSATKAAHDPEEDAVILQVLKVQESILDMQRKMLAQRGMTV